MNISIIIPAYNEEKRIGSTLKKIIAFLKKTQKIKQFEIIVVDDYSQDKTQEIIENVRIEMRASRKELNSIKNKENRGKGYSVKRGVLNAHYDHILFSDADLSTPIEELEKLLSESKENEIIIASRNLKDSKIEIKQPWFRSTLGKIFPTLVNLLLIQGIRDTQCGFKLFTRKAAKMIFPRQTLDGFAFDAELLFIAKKHHIKIKEVPVIWKNAEGSTVDPIKDALKMFKDILKIRWNNIQGKYR